MSADPTAVLPAGWRMVRLSEVAEQTLGKMLDAQKNKGLPLPYLRNPNVRWFDVDTADLKEMPFESHELERYGLRAGDVVVCEGGEAGRAAIWDGRMPQVKFQKAIHRVRPGPDLYNRFLVYRLMADYQSGRLADYYTGATIKHLTGQDLARYQIPLPPIAEQRRIADVLDRAEALRAKRRATLAQLDTLAQSIFLDLFGDPATNPKKWPMVSIGDLCEVKGGKRLPKGEEYSLTPTPFRYIRVTDIRAGVVDESALVFLKPAVQATIARYIVNTGDVIISIAGSIGQIAPVPPSLDGANLTENAAKLVPRAHGVYDPVYLAALLQTSFAQSQIDSHIGQVTIGKLALFRIEKLNVPLPPLPVQREFSHRLPAVDNLKSAHRASLAKLDALFASLQHRAFRGEL